MSHKKFLDYPFTEMFQVIDTMPVPHPYCIGTRHVSYAAEYCNGILTEDAIRRAEKAGASCCTCFHLSQKKGVKILSYSEHKQSLLIEVNDPEDRDLKDVPGLQEYLLSIKEKTEKDGFAGWSFIKGK